MSGFQSLPGATMARMKQGIRTPDLNPVREAGGL